MIRTLCVVGTALALSVGSAGVALAADATGPNSPACAQAREDVQDQQAKVNAENDPVKKAELRAQLDDLKEKRDRLCSGRGGNHGGDHDGDRWDDHDGDWDRDRYHGPRGNHDRPIVVVAACDSDRALQLRYRNDWRGVADRYTLTLREARSSHSDGGTRITRDEARRLSTSYGDYNRHRSQWLSATSKRKLNCHDDGGDVSVINVEQPPVEINYTINGASTKESTGKSTSGSADVTYSEPVSGGQVSRVPRGAAETGDGSVEV